MQTLSSSTRSFQGHSAGRRGNKTKVTFCAVHAWECQSHDHSSVQGGGRIQSCALEEEEAVSTMKFGGRGEGCWAGKNKVHLSLVFVLRVPA